MVWEDAQGGEVAYWFPSLMAQSASADDLAIINKSN
jgi:hypothetical protein